MENNPRVKSYATDVANQINLELANRRIPVQFLINQGDLIKKLSDRHFQDTPEDDALDVAIAINNEVLAQAKAVGQGQVVALKLLGYVDLSHIILKSFVSQEVADNYRNNNLDKLSETTMDLRL